MTVGTPPSSSTGSKQYAAGSGAASASKTTMAGSSATGAKYDPSPKTAGTPPPHAGNPALGIPPSGPYPPGYYGPPGAYPPPGYGGVPPGYAGAPPGAGMPPMYGYPMSRANHPQAVTAMVLGIVSLGVHILTLVLGSITYGVCCLVTGLAGIILGFLAIYFGTKVKKEIAASMGQIGGQGFALAGQICGGIGLGLSGLVLLLGVLFLILIIMLGGGMYFF